VKALERSEGGECDPPDSWCYWRREAAFYSSDLPASLPTPLRAPRAYAVTETTTSCWVWMERVADDLVETWQPDDYHRVAVAAGESAGTQLAHGRPPSRPWLVQGFMRSVLADGGLWAGLMSRESTGSAWTLPLVQESFDRVDNERYDSLWARRHDLLSVLDRLPPVLCHNDFHRRNVLPKDGTAAPVVVDWAFAGTGRGRHRRGAPHGRDALLLRCRREPRRGSRRHRLRRLPGGAPSGEGGAGTSGWSRWGSPPRSLSGKA